jgi:hypothetical protein
VTISSLASVATAGMSMATNSASGRGWAYDPGVSCTRRLADGSTCGRTAFVLDARFGRTLCREHALAPLERVLGQRPDLEEKAEYVLRFLGLASQDRHELLEALSPTDRGEFIRLAQLFDTDE